MQSRPSCDYEFCYEENVNRGSKIACFCLVAACLPALVHGIQDLSQGPHMAAQVMSHVPLSFDPHLPQDSPLQEPHNNLPGEQAPINEPDVNVAKERDDPAVTAPLKADYVGPRIPEGNDNNIPEIHQITDTPSNTKSLPPLINESKSSSTSIPLIDGTETTTKEVEALDTNADAVKPELINEDASFTERDSQATHIPENDVLGPAVHVKQGQDEQIAEKQIPPVATAESSAHEPDETLTPDATHSAGGSDDAIAEKLTSETTSTTDPGPPTTRGPKVVPPLVALGHDIEKPEAPASEGEIAPTATSRAFSVGFHDTATSSTPEPEHAVEQHGTLKAELIGKDPPAAESVAPTDPAPSEPAPSVYVTEGQTAPVVAPGGSADESYKRLESTETERVTEGHDADDEELVIPDVFATEPTQTAPLPEHGGSVPAVHDSDSEEQEHRVPEAEVQIPPATKAEDSLDDSQERFDSATIGRVGEDPDALAVKPISRDASATVPGPQAESIQENDGPSITAHVKVDPEEQFAPVPSDTFQTESAQTDGGPSITVHVKEEPEDHVPEEPAAPVPTEASANESHNSDATQPVGEPSLLDVTDKPDVPKEPFIEVSKAILAHIEGERSAEPETVSGGVEVPQKEDLNIPAADLDAKALAVDFSNSDTEAQGAPHTSFTNAPGPSDPADASIAHHANEVRGADAAPESGPQDIPVTAPVVETLDNRTEAVTGAAQDDAQPTHVVDDTIPERVHDSNDGDHLPAPPAPVGASNIQSDKSIPEDSTADAGEPLVSPSAQDVASEGHSRHAEPLPASADELAGTAEITQAPSSVLIPLASIANHGAAAVPTDAEKPQLWTDDVVPSDRLNVENSTAGELPQSPPVSVLKAANDESPVTSEPSAAQNNVSNDGVPQTSPSEPLAGESSSSPVPKEPDGLQVPESTGTAVTPEATTEAEIVQSVKSVDHEAEDAPETADADAFKPTKAAEDATGNISDELPQPPLDSGDSALVGTPEDDPSKAPEVDTSTDAVHEDESPASGSQEDAPVKLEAEIDRVEPGKVAATVDVDEQEGATTSVLPQPSASETPDEHHVLPEQSPSPASLVSGPLDRPKDVAIVEDPSPETGVATATVEAIANAEEEPITEEMPAPSDHISRPEASAPAPKAADVGADPIQDPDPKVIDPVLEERQSIGESIGKIQDTVPVESNPPTTITQSVAEETAPTSETIATSEALPSAPKPASVGDDVTVNVRLPPESEPVTLIDKPAEKAQNAVPSHPPVASVQSVTEEIARTSETDTAPEVPSLAQEPAPGGGDAAADVKIAPPESELVAPTDKPVEETQGATPADIIVPGAIAQPAGRETTQTSETNPTAEVLLSAQKPAPEDDDDVENVPLESEPVTLTGKPVEEAQDAVPVGSILPGATVQLAEDEIAQTYKTDTAPEVPSSAPEPVSEGDDASVNVRLVPPGSESFTVTGEPVEKVQDAIPVDSNPPATFAQQVADETAPSSTTDSTPEVSSSTQKPAPEGDDAAVDVEIVPQKSEPVLVTDKPAEKAQDAALVGGDPPAAIAQPMTEEIAQTSKTGIIPELVSLAQKPASGGDDANVDVGIVPLESESVTLTGKPAEKVQDAIFEDSNPPTAIAQPAADETGTTSKMDTTSAVLSSAHKPAPEGGDATVDVRPIPPESEPVAPTGKPVEEDTVLVVSNSLAAIASPVPEETAQTSETDPPPEVPVSAQKLAPESGDADVNVGLVSLESEPVTLTDKPAEKAQGAVHVDSNLPTAIAQPVVEGATSTSETDTTQEAPSSAQQAARKGDDAAVNFQFIPPASESVTLTDMPVEKIQDAVLVDSNPIATIAQTVTEEILLTSETDTTPDVPPSVSKPTPDGDHAAVNVGPVPLESKSIAPTDKLAEKVQDAVPVDSNLLAAIAQPVAEGTVPTSETDTTPETLLSAHQSAPGGGDATVNVGLVALKSEPLAPAGKLAEGVQDALRVDSNPPAAIAQPVTERAASTSETDTAPKVPPSASKLALEGDDDAVSVGPVPAKSKLTEQAQDAVPVDSRPPAAIVQPVVEETAQTSEMGTNLEVPSSVEKLAPEGVTFVPPESEPITVTGASEFKSNDLATDPALDSNAIPAQVTVDEVPSSQAHSNDKLAENVIVTDETPDAKGPIKDVESANETKAPIAAQNEETFDVPPEASPNQVSKIIVAIEESNEAIVGRGDIQSVALADVEIPSSSAPDKHGSVELRTTDVPSKVLDPPANGEGESASDVPTPTSDLPHDPIVPAESEPIKILPGEPDDSTTPLRHIEMHDPTEESVVTKDGLAEPTRTIDTASSPDVATLVDTPLQVPSAHTETSQIVAEVAAATLVDVTVTTAKLEPEDIGTASTDSAAVIAPIGVVGLTPASSDSFATHPRPVGESKLDEDVNIKDGILVPSDKREELHTGLDETSAPPETSPDVSESTDSTEHKDPTSLLISQTDEDSTKKSLGIASTSIDAPNSTSTPVEPKETSKVPEPDLIPDSETKPVVVEEKLATSETPVPVPPANADAEAAIIGDPEPVAPVETTDKASDAEDAVVKIPPQAETNDSTVVESTLPSNQSLLDSDSLPVSTFAMAASDNASKETPVAHAVPEQATIVVSPPTISEASATTIVQPIAVDDGRLPEDTPKALSDALPESSKADEDTTVIIERPPQPERMAPDASQTLLNPILDDVHTDSSIAPSSPRSDLGVSAITDIGDDTRSEVSTASKDPVPPTSPPARDYDEDEEVNIDLLRELWKKEPPATPIAYRAPLSRISTKDMPLIEVPSVEGQESEASTPEPSLLLADKSSPETTATLMDIGASVVDDSVHESPVHEDDVLDNAPAELPLGGLAAVVTEVIPATVEQTAVTADSSESHVLADIDAPAEAPSDSSAILGSETTLVPVEPPIAEDASRESHMVEGNDSQLPSDGPAAAVSEAEHTEVEAAAVDSHESHVLAVTDSSATLLPEAAPIQQTEAEVVIAHSREATVDESIPSASHAAKGTVEVVTEVPAQIPSTESTSGKPHGDESLSEHNYELASATLASASVRRSNVPPLRRDITPRSISKDATTIIQSAEPTETKTLPVRVEPPEQVFKLTEPPADDPARLASSSSALRPFPAKGEDNEGLPIEIPNRVRFESSLSTRSGFPQLPGAWTSPITATEPSFEQAEGEFVKPEGRKSRCVIM